MTTSRGTNFENSKGSTKLQMHGVISGEQRRRTHGSDKLRQMIIKHSSNCTYDKHHNEDDGNDIVSHAMSEIESGLHF